jgi:geranylgeranyl pyrophosphate synthase
MLNQESLSENRLGQLVSAIQTSGAIERSIEQAREFSNQALDALGTLPFTPEHEALEDLSRYIVNRHR